MVCVERKGSPWSPKNAKNEDAKIEKRCRERARLSARASSDDFVELYGEVFKKYLDFLKTSPYITLTERLAGVLKIVINTTR